MSTSRDTSESVHNYNTGFCQDSVQASNLLILHNHPAQFHLFHDFQIHLYMNGFHTYVSSPIIFPECQVYTVTCL